MLPLAADDPRSRRARRLLAIMGAVLLARRASCARGFVTDLLSKPIRVGYLNGIALIVIVSQIPKLLGFSIDATSLAGGHGDRPRAGERRRQHASPSSSVWVPCC